MEILTTQRLRLRTWQDNDFDRLHGILSDPVTMSHWPQPLTAAESRAWLERSKQGMREYGYARWCCEQLHDGQIVGDVGVVRMELAGEWINDLGYIIHKDFWRRGYAFEAASAIVEWARANKLQTLVANMAVDNVPSVAVARKLGMTLQRQFTNERNMNKETCWYELMLPD